MDSLLQNNIFVFFIVTLIFTSVGGIKKTERARVALIYIFATAMAAAGTISPWLVLAGSTAVLFVLLEVLSDDEKRIQLFTTPKYKLTDFLYRMIFEYYYPLFIVAVAMLNLNLHQPYLFIMYSVSVLLTLTTVALLMSQKYATKSVTSIIAKLESKFTIYQLTPNGHIQQLLSILTDLEDKGYFVRSKDQHSLPMHMFFTKGWAYVKAHSGMGLLGAFLSLFRRGYGTIEMQLIRTIGIEAGYTTVYKRKVFEFLYANMVFNSYRDYLERAGNDSSQYRTFILRQYVEHVPVKINGRIYYPQDKTSSLLQLFDKQKIEDVSPEEFFVWCMGLTWGYIDASLVHVYADFLHAHAIDPSRVTALIRTITTTRA